MVYKRQITNKFTTQHTVRAWYSRQLREFSCMCDQKSLYRLSQEQITNKPLLTLIFHMSVYIIKETL